MPGPIFRPSPHLAPVCATCGFEVAVLPNRQYRCYTPSCAGRSRIYTPVERVDPANLAMYGVAREHPGNPGPRPGELPWVGKAKKVRKR